MSVSIPAKSVFNRKHGRLTKRFSFVLLFALVPCTGSEDAAVKEFLTKSMNIGAGNLDVSSIELGDKKVITLDKNPNMVLFGFKETTTYPLTVTFKVKEDCVAVAEAIKNDIFFNEKKVSCRSVKAGEEPNLRYVKAYKMGNFGQQTPVYENGKIIKSGESFTATGEWAHIVTAKDSKTVSAAVFQSLK